MQIMTTAEIGANKSKKGKSAAFVKSLNGTEAITKNLVIKKVKGKAENDDYLGQEYYFNRLYLKRDLCVALDIGTNTATQTAQF